MNINLIFSLLIVNDYLCYLCEGCMSSQLTIVFSVNLFLKKDILLAKFQQKEVLPEFFPKTEQNSSPVNLSIYSD